MEVREPSAKYLARSGYKQTEVGVIPEDWAVVPLRRLISSVEYGSSAKSNPKGHSPVLRMGNLQGGKIDWNDLVFTDDESEIRKYSLISGDVLFNRTNTIDLVGKTSIYKGERPAVFAGYLIRISADKALLDSRFLNYVLNAEFSRKHSAKVLSVAVGQANINAQKLKSYPIPLPPTKAEQEAIAEALSDADALIESLEQLLAKKCNLKQGAMQELLTGEKRLPGFSGMWEERSLLELAGGRKELFDDGDWIESEHITDEGIRLVQTGNIGVGAFVEKDYKKYIFEKSFISLRCKEVKQGDLLICRLADPAGRSCVLPDIGEAKIVTSVDVTIFRPPEAVANKVFLANIFSTDEWFRAVSDRSGGTTHKRIARGALGRLKIKVPSIDEQTAIATILSDMDANIAALEEKLSKARHIKQAMMQVLLTGRIRLVESTHVAMSASC